MRILSNINGNRDVQSQVSKLCFTLCFICFLSVTSFAYPQRIVSGIPSVTEMLFALDLGDRVVGVTTNCDYPPAAKKKEKIGGFFLNLEKVVSLKPDLIVMVEDAQRRDIQRFKNYGLRVFTINPHTVADVMDSLVKLGEVTGRKRRAEQLAAEMLRRIGGLQPRGLGLETILRRPKALTIIGNKPLIVVGGGTFIGDIMRYAGVSNLAERAKIAYPQYSFEQLLSDNPDLLIIAKGVIGAGELANDSNWRRLSAVKEKNILFINADVLSRPGPRVVEAIETIARFAHGRK